MSLPDGSLKAKLETGFNCYSYLQTVFCIWWGEIYLTLVPLTGMLAGQSSRVA